MNTNDAPIKILEQMAIKKISQSHKISEVNAVTGSLTQNSKTRSFTAPEALNLFAYGVEKTVLGEFFSGRSDDKDAVNDMLQQIEENGIYYQSKKSSSGLGQTAATLSYYLLGAGLENDILNFSKVSIDGKTQDTRQQAQSSD